MHLLKLFAKIVKLRFLALIEYPGAYMAGIVAQWLSYGISAFMIYMMVDRFGALGGWLPQEITFLYAVWLMCYALGASFSFNVSMDFRQMAVSGLLDEALTRPAPSLFYLIATEYNLGYVSHMSLALGVLIFSIVRLGQSWNVLQWGFLLLLILSGATINACLMLILSMPALLVKGKSPVSVFYWQGREFAQYPISIYPRALQWVFTSILPFGFIGYYPLSALLGKDDALMGTALNYLSPLVAALLILLTIYCWNFVSGHYESAGT